MTRWDTPDAPLYLVRVEYPTVYTYAVHISDDEIKYRGSLETAAARKVEWPFGRTLVSTHSLVPGDTGTGVTRLLSVRAALEHEVEDIKKNQE